MLPGSDREAVWQTTVDVLDDFFEIDQVARGDQIGDNLLTKHRVDPEAATDIQPRARDGTSHAVSTPAPDTPPSTSIRRRAFAHLVPVDSGFLLDVNVFQEVEDVNLPDPEFMQVAGSKDERDLPFGVDLPGPPEPGWFPNGRDEILEGSLISEIRSRLDSTQPLSAYGEPDFHSPVSQYLRQAPRNLVEDYKHFYSVRGLVLLGAGIGVAAIIANTQIDSEVAEKDQMRLRTSSTDSAAHWAKQFGEPTVMFPVYIAALLTGTVADRYPIAGPISEWGDRTFRGMLVGGPPMLLLQRVTGASRPGEIDSGSCWNFWGDNNGVSGHAFVGATPFISAAKMTDNPWLKAGLYVGSTFTGWSRVNDDAHYFSQVALGWWLAYLGATAVDVTQSENRHWSVTPVPVAGGLGVGVELRH